MSKNDASNLAKWLEARTAADGEDIEAVVLGEHYNKQYDDPHSDTAPQKIVLAWAAARPWLDEDYDSGFGGADCRSFHAYTKSWVYFVSEYDGATSLGRVPRNPTAGALPYFAGTWE